MEKREIILRTTLKNYIDQLELAIKGLKDAYHHCKEKSLDDRYQPRQLESFDALAMRFSRTSDIFTQKVLRNIFFLLREDVSTYIDLSRKAEKLGVTSSENELISLRDLRNSIAHEYLLENWMEIFENIMKYTPVLLENIEKTRIFVKEKFDI